MGLATIDIIVIAVYAIFIFALAQWVSRDKGGAQKNSNRWPWSSRV